MGCVCLEASCLLFYIHRITEGKKSTINWEENEVRNLVDPNLNLYKHLYQVNEGCPWLNTFTDKCHMHLTGTEEKSF